MLISADDFTVDWKKGIVTENFRAVEPMFDGQRIFMYPSVSSRKHTFYSVPVLYDGVLRKLVVRYDTSANKYEIAGFGSMIENGMMRTGGFPDFGHIIAPLYMIISDDPTNEQIGVKIVDTNTGATAPFMSFIDEQEIQVQKVYMKKWKTGEPVVFTRDSAITNKQINRGMYIYTLTFDEPGGDPFDTAMSDFGLIVVKDGKVSRFSSEKSKEIIKVAAKNN